MPLHRATLLIAASLAALLDASLASAQSPTPEQIVRALQGGRSRAIGVGQAAAPLPAPEQKAFLKKLLVEQKSRAIVVEERKQVAEIVQKSALPAINLEVTFDFDSAAITAQAEPTLAALGQALSGSALKGKAFLVGGHTDAKGEDAYNVALSQRRAAAVKQYLVDKFKLGTDTLLAIGYGEEQLKNAANPLAGENRRVQIVNLLTQ